MNGIKFTNLFFVFSIFIAHFFAPSDYVWTFHTMSEMAGQFVPRAWILTSGFLLTGIGYIFFAIREQNSFPKWLKYLTVLNGLFIALLALFPTSYDEMLTGYPIQETIVILHRYIAYIGNFFTLLIIGLHIIHTPSKKTRNLHLGFLILTLIFSAIFVFYFPNIRGLFQRLILLTTSVWTWTLFGKGIKTYLSESPKQHLQ